MKNLIIEQVGKQLNWRQRLLVKVFEKDFLEIYHIIRIQVINNFL